MTRPVRPYLSSVFTAALIGLLVLPGAAQQDALATEVKVPFGKKFKYELPIPFELDCPHHVNAWSDDTSVFDVQLSGGFTKTPKITIFPKFAGVAALNFDIVGKDQYEGEPGDCTGNFASSVSIRVLPDDKQLDKLVKQALDSLKKGLKEDYGQHQETFDQSVSQLLNDYSKGYINLDPALTTLNSLYFTATIDNLLDTRTGLTSVASQLSSNLASDGATPGFVGGHSQAGAWGRWDQGVYDISMEHEGASQDLDGSMWKAWNTLRKHTDDPAEQREFTLVRASYDYQKGYGVVPPNSGDWVAPAARLPATIYYMIGTAKECDPNSGQLWAVGLADPSASLSGEIRIGGTTEAADFSADGNGVWIVGFGYQGYGHAGGDGESMPPLPSGLARYDVFYEGEANPTNSMFLTIP
ncbi:MAG: hypothetical protein ACYTCU_00605 [Planctomycetota bacterium]